MEREKIERVARKIARVHAGEPDGTVRAVVDGIEWALSHQWTRVADRKPQPDAVCFHKGYTNTTMTFAIEGKSYGYGNPEWGAPKDRKVLKIQLGKRL